MTLHDGKEITRRGRGSHCRRIRNSSYTGTQTVHAGVALN